MATSSRYHIDVAPAPPSEAGYPADFYLEEGATYVKYGHPVFAGKTQRGDEYWTAEIVTQTWYQAETGRIPISGAGYGGKFAGEGFDGMWLDMSEIVRPTRDGIHGREYVSTAVNLGTYSGPVQFDETGSHIRSGRSWIKLPVPVIYNPLPIPPTGRGGYVSVARAARELGVLAILLPEEIEDDLIEYVDSLAVRLNATNDLDRVPDWVTPQYVEIVASNSMAEVLVLAQERWPDALFGAHVTLADTTGDEAIELVSKGVNVIHVYADDIGQDTSGRPLPVSLRDVHTALVKAGTRDQVTLIASGGIAAADHVAKAIACGADLVAVDFIINVAWGCSLWATRAHALQKTPKSMSSGAVNGSST